MAEPVILINAFEVPAADADAFVAAWQKACNYLRSQPGYIDTVLHKSITPDAEFQFVNVAHWQTAEDFIAATQNPGGPRPGHHCLPPVLDAAAERPLPRHGVHLQTHLSGE